MWLDNLMQEIMYTHARAHTKKFYSTPSFLAAAKIFQVLGPDGSSMSPSGPSSRSKWSLNSCRTSRTWNTNGCNVRRWFQHFPDLNFKVLHSIIKEFEEWWKIIDWIVILSPQRWQSLLTWILAQVMTKQSTCFLVVWWNNHSGIISI